MFIQRKFPNTRLRRLRRNNNLINLVSETNLTQDDLIQPIFVKENFDGKEEIDSMPNIYRYGINQALNEIEDIIQSGINSIAIFPVIDSENKDEKGSQATKTNNFISNSIKEIKRQFPDLVLVADVALDPYTDHGHDGIIINDEVDNDETNKILIEQSLILADAGADIVAPSDLMDGRIGLIREALETHNFKNTILLSYAAKLGKSSKSSYQMSQKNKQEALQEIALDINEGADIVMVKPAMPYLDIIHNIKDTFQIPTFAYQVSGEYSMLKLSISKGWLDSGVMLESLIGIKRAGADAILSYAAKEISKEIQNK